MPLAHDLHLFADPWEQVRLLSDPGRNSALLSLLQRRAPDARVLEIGSGTGIWACAAARLGARQVVAVEASGMADMCRELVERNGLGDRVEVIEDLIEDIPPRPMDLVFSELLNADPFSEGLLEASRVGAAWVGPQGHLAPSRIQVLAQLVHSPDSRREAHAARSAVDGLAASLGLDLAPLTDMLGAPGPDRLMGSKHSLLGEPTVLWDLQLGSDDEPAPVTARLPLHQVMGADNPAPSGVVVWFQARLDDGLWLANRPGTPGHWGQLVIGWVEQAAGSRTIEVHARVDDDGVHIMPVT